MCFPQCAVVLRFQLLTSAYLQLEANQIGLTDWKAPSNSKSHTFNCVCISFFFFVYVNFKPPKLTFFRICYGDWQLLKEARLQPLYLLLYSAAFFHFQMAG